MASIKLTNDQAEQLVRQAQLGDDEAIDQVIVAYQNLVRLKAMNFFLVGGSRDDLIQEGLIGLYKAIRDFRPDGGSNFTGFAELCITRQIITAIKTATRNKHQPLNGAVNLESSSGGEREAAPLSDVLTGFTAADPALEVIAGDELRSLVATLSTCLSELESRVLGMRLDGCGYTAIAAQLNVNPKAVDNALGRIRRKIRAHLDSREILDVTWNYSRAA
jgi:RNA polymerase sporulation-specific sigma factor